MAKAPKTTAPPADTAPAQPWAKATAKADSAAVDAKPDTTNAPADEGEESSLDAKELAASEAIDAETEVVNDDNKPSELHDQMTPAGGADDVHELAREGEEGNGGGVPGEVSSEAVDQLTPTGPSPKEVDEAAENLTPESSPDRVSAEAKDQVTPTGEDLSKKIHEQFEALDEAEKEEFDAFMRDQATAKLAQLTRGREARAMEVNLVDGNEHFGTKVPVPPTPRNLTVEA